MASPEVVCNIQAEDFVIVSSSLGPFYGYHSNDVAATALVEDPGETKTPDGIVPAAPFSGTLDFASKYEPTIVRKTFQEVNFFRNDAATYPNNARLVEAQVPTAFASRTPFTLRGRVPAYKVEIGSAQEQANSKGT